MLKLLKNIHKGYNFRSLNLIKIQRNNLINEFHLFFRLIIN